MSSNLIANRYARALMTVIDGNQALADKAQEFLAACQHMFELPETKSILKSPVMPADLKKALFAYAAEKTAAGQEFTAFAEQVVNAGRTRIIPEIVKSFNRMLSESRGQADALVTTAEPLSTSAKSELSAGLAKVFNKKITLQNEIDKKVLGGLVVKVGNYSIDLSLRSRLDSVAEFAQR
jgi:F-type H+-transporting ATPase subunit delta